IPFKFLESTSVIIFLREDKPFIKFDSVGFNGSKISVTPIFFAETASLFKASEDLSQASSLFSLKYPKPAVTSTDGHSHPCATIISFWKYLRLRSRMNSFLDAMLLG